MRKGPWVEPFPFTTALTVLSQAADTFNQGKKFVDNWNNSWNAKKKVSIGTSRELEYRKCSYMKKKIEKSENEKRNMIHQKMEVQVSQAAILPQVYLQWEEEWKTPTGSWQSSLKLLIEATTLISLSSRGDSILFSNKCKFQLSSQ